MIDYQEALRALLGTLVRESGGVGKNLQPLEPQDIAGIALFLRDGRVLGISMPDAEVVSPRPFGAPPFGKGGRGGDTP